MVFFKWKSNSLCLKNIQKRPTEDDFNRCPERAAGALRQSGKLRQSAREFNVSKTTLKRFVDQMSIDENIQQKSQAASVWVTGIAFFLQKGKKISQTILNH